MLIESFKNATYETSIIVIGDIEVVMSVSPYFNEIEYRVYIEKQLVKDELYELSDVFDYIESLKQDDNKKLNLSPERKTGPEFYVFIQEEYVNGDMVLFDLLDKGYGKEVEYIVKHGLVKEDDVVYVNMQYNSKNSKIDIVPVIFYNDISLISFDTAMECKKCIDKNPGLCFNDFIF